MVACSCTCTRVCVCVYVCLVVMLNCGFTAEYHFEGFLHIHVDVCVPVCVCVPIDRIAHVFTWLNIFRSQLLPVQASLSIVTIDRMGGKSLHLNRYNGRKHRGVISKH